MFSQDLKAQIDQASQGRTGGAEAKAKVLQVAADASEEKAAKAEAQEMMGVAQDE